MSLYFALQTVENNKNKKSVKFQEDMLNFCDFIQVYVFTTNHHLKPILCTTEYGVSIINYSYSFQRMTLKLCSRIVNILKKLILTDVKT